MLDNYIIFDIETDGLNSTKIHVLSYSEYIDGKWEINSIYTEQEIKDFFRSREDKALVGHMITKFDIPEIERLLNIKIKSRLVDTLALSWYLYPKVAKHGLAEWGDFFGVKKPEIEDWVNLSIEEYTVRCEEDVKINTNLFIKSFNYLLRIYDNDLEQVNNAIDHVTFMLQVSHYQTSNPFKLDISKTVHTLDMFLEEIRKRNETLMSVLPKVPVYRISNPVKNPLKKNGEPTRMYLKRKELMLDRGVPLDFEGPFRYVHSYKEPNPASHTQVKDWLFSIGWKPITFNFNYSKKEGKEVAVPQIKKDGKLCESVERLIEQNPEVEVLKDLAVLSHRSKILEGFLKNVDDDGYIEAGVIGTTNTLRFRHKICTNLPGVNGKKDFADGEWIRSLLTCDEGYEICGSDVSALENMSMMNYINPIDPGYVEEMQEEGYDPHLSMGITANILSKKESDFYKKYKSMPEDYQYTEEQNKVFKRIHLLRHQAKTCNYSAIYLIGAKKLSRTLDISIKEAEELLKGFWKKNWAIEEFTKRCQVKTIDNQMWVYLPITKMWLSLRDKKDTFSTVNQGTGSYIFFRWVKEILSRPSKIKFNATFHDEVVLTVLKGYREQITKYLKFCMEKVNKDLGLEIPIGVDVDFGNTYADVH